MKFKRPLYVFSFSAILAVTGIQASVNGIAHAASPSQTVGAFPAGTQGVTVEPVNFRTGPGVSYSAITMLQAGLTVELISRTADNWYQVKVGDTTGWVSGDYIVPKTADAPGTFRIAQYPSSPNFYEVKDGMLYHVLGTPEYRSASYLVGAAPANFQSGNVYVRDASFQFYRRAADGDKLVGTYTPPYVALDLRLPAKVQAADIDNFIRSNRPDSPLIGKGQAFIDAQNKYGVNAQYLVAHAIHESDWGMSPIAKDKNNLFGYQAYDSDPYGSAAYFATIEDCVNYIAYFVATSYVSPAGKWYGGSSTLNGMNKYYATDPYWSEKIGGIMARLRAYDQNDYSGAAVMAVRASKPAGPIEAPVSTALTEQYPAGTTATTTDEVNFRAMPSTSADILGRLPKGTSLALLGKGTGQWYKVQNGSQTGWVYGDYITITYAGGAVPASRSGNPFVNKPISFPDVPSDHWSKAAIDKLTGMQIISGYPDGTYKPAENISREQSAILMVKSLRLDMANRPVPKASDVGTDNSYYQAIATVMAEGIFAGDNGKFYPDKTLTRAEMASVLVKAFNLKGNSSHNFADAKNHWGSNAIGILAANGITSGYPDGTFKPDQPVTREEFAVFLSKVIK